METYEVEVTDAPNIKFTGECLGQVTGPKVTGQWTILLLYKTQAGSFVCSQKTFSIWVGARDYFSGEVCQTLGGVQEFFGFSDLAKELYEEAGLPTAREID